MNNSGASKIFSEVAQHEAQEQYSENYLLLNECTKLFLFFTMRDTIIW